MPIVEFLHTVPAPPKKKCEGKIKDYDTYCSHYRARREGKRKVEGAQCGISASIKVNGKWYCGKHAGNAALEYLIDIDKE